MEHPPVPAVAEDSGSNFRLNRIGRKYGTSPQKHVRFCGLNLCLRGLFVAGVS